MAKVGTITLLKGPMKSGKTDRLVSIYHNARASSKHLPLAIGYSGTDRGEKTHVTSRTGASMPARFVDSLTEQVVHEMVSSSADIILIDEGQFFENLVVVCLYLVGAGKHIYVSALNGTFKREPWEVISGLSAVCDFEETMAAWCDHCQVGRGIFSHRSTTSTSLVEIGDHYHTLCRSCWNTIESSF